MADAQIKIRPVGFEKTNKLLRNMTNEMKKNKKSVDRVDIAYKRLTRTQAHQRKVAALAAFQRAQTISQWDRMKTSVISLRGAMVGAGVLGFGMFVKGTLDASNAMRSAENGFVRLMSARGVGGARRLLVKFNDTLDGMVDRATVASTASRLMATNSNLNAKSIEKVLRFSRDWADTTGQQLMPVIQSLSSALGGMELETIRRLGLEVDFNTALKDKAKALGKSASALTEEEKRAAKTAVVLDAIAKKHKEIGRTAITAANNINRINANWTNLKARLGEGFGEAAGPALQALADVTSGKATASEAAGRAILEAGVLGLELMEASGVDLGAENRRQEIKGLEKEDFGAVGNAAFRANAAVSTMFLSEFYYATRDLVNGAIQIKDRITG